MRVETDSWQGTEMRVTDKSGLYSFIYGPSQQYGCSMSTGIQSWLLAKNLTWQKGFLSKSECAGQEGQLIPEIHDPLLNDPDVLR